ncbi:hypothetical protein GCK32_022914 [Trichostrongylus colubriformis]|uniref:Helicase C-terminal domain-containing protein n=1 Tax=Trichostrongylus colubriformis TaxID=6319 RepID=A0AAN8EVG6_TRICO
MVIVDESHVKQFKSMLLVRYIYQAADYRRNAMNRLHAVFMSATIRMWRNRGYEEKCDNQSNHAITDYEVRAADELEERRKAEDICISKIKDGLSVLHLVPAAEGKMGAKAVAQRIRSKVSCPVVPLSPRSTYDMAMQKLAEVKENQKVIVAADILEVGTNLKVDVVIDLGVKRTYTCRRGHVRMETTRINQASWTQRRGRVGRKKPGEYHLWGHEVASGLVDQEDACPMDLSMCAMMFKNSSTKLPLLPSTRN